MMKHCIVSWCKTLRRMIVPVLLCTLLFYVNDFCRAEITEDRGFSVQRIGQMICYGDNTFSVQAPEEGELSITVYDDVCTYRVIREKIETGKNEIRWDGCGYNGEPLETKYYYFDFLLNGTSGENYKYMFRSPVVENAQHLQFVLPSAGTAYLSEPVDWFVEIKAVRNGSVVFEMFTGNTREPCYIFEKSVHTGRVEHFTLEKLAGRSIPEAGIYSVKVYEKSRPEEVAEFSLRIEAESPEPAAVKVTGEIMPSADADDREIWDAMMKPSVIVDIDPTEHQKVYSEPDPSSISLGTLHGQTQGLSVFLISGEWAKIGAWNHESADYVEGWVPLERLRVVEPNHEYGILVDKKKQTMTVYYKGNRVETLLVSTGRMDPGKFDRETSAGCFLSGLHRVDFSTQGLKYDFVIQYDGGNLLHQIPYSSDGKKDFTQGKSYLGTKASHACIRIQEEPGRQNGINAYWLWTHLPYRTRIIILDDPEERSIEKARLCGGPPVDTGYSLFPVSEVPEDGIVMTFAGDAIPAYSEDPNGFDAVFREYGPDYCFSGIQEIFGQDDITCISLGCVLKENTLGEDPYRNVKWRGLPEYKDIFIHGSVELVSLGDEHLYDYMQDGYVSTTAALEQTVKWTGKGHPQIVEIKGCRLGFATVCQQDYLENRHIVEQEIRSLRNAGCDFVIVQCHWGNEKDTVHGKIQEAMARACAREGADLVIGRHPEAVEGIGDIEGMPVIWSLGRVLCDGSLRRKSYDTLAVQAIFVAENGKKKTEIRLIPLLTCSSLPDQKNDYRPVPADKEDAERIKEKIQKDTGFRISFK